MLISRQKIAVLAWFLVLILFLSHIAESYVPLRGSSKSRTLRSAFVYKYPTVKYAGYCSLPNLRTFARIYAEVEGLQTEESPLFETLKCDQPFDECLDSTQEQAQEIISESFDEPVVLDGDEKAYVELYEKFANLVDKVPPDAGYKDALHLLAKSLAPNGDVALSEKLAKYNKVDKALTCALDETIQNFERSITNIKKRQAPHKILGNSVTQFFTSRRYFNADYVWSYFDRYPLYKEKQQQRLWGFMKFKLSNALFIVGSKFRGTGIRRILNSWASSLRVNACNEIASTAMTQKSSHVINLERLLHFYGQTKNSISFDDGDAKVERPNVTQDAKTPLRRVLVGTRAPSLITRPLASSAKHNAPWTLTFLGTGSRQPTDTRMTSTMAFTYDEDGKVWLFDCGEGTIARMQMLKINPKTVDRIFITHLHGDHCFGLYSFISNVARNLPITVYGPVGIAKMLFEVMQQTTTNIVPKFYVYELIFNPEDERHKKPWVMNHSCFGGFIYPEDAGHYTIYQNEKCKVMAAPLKHLLPTVGYVIKELKPQGNMEEARKIVICQDSSDSSKMIPIAMNPNILIHEATMSPVSALGSSLLMQLIYQLSARELDKSTLAKLDEIVSHDEVTRSCVAATFASISMKLRNRCFVTERSLLNLVKSLAQHKDKEPDEDLDDAEILSKSIHLLQMLNISTQINVILKQALKLESQLQQLFVIPKELKISNGWIKTVMEYAIKAVNKDETSANPTAEFMESIKPSLVKYWSQEGKQYESQTKDWYELYGRCIRPSGHSSPYDAGQFASRINANKLFLTHLSSKYPDDGQLVSVINCARLEHQARMAIQDYAQNATQPKLNNIATRVAYDGLIVQI